MGSRVALRMKLLPIDRWLLPKGRSRRNLFDVAHVRVALENLFGEDLHLARVRSMANGVVGVLGAAVVSIAAIGRAYAQLAEIESKSGVKQVDRLLSNDGLVLDELMPLWIQHVVGNIANIVVAMDWTDFDDDDHTTLCVYLVTTHGLRTGDMHAVKWEHFDTTLDGAFTWGIALRRKTARPQRIEVPEVLRPILRDWWTRADKPTTGLVFPPLRGKHATPDEKTGVYPRAKQHVSHAGAMRRDLQDAFEAHRKANPDAPAEVMDAFAPVKDSPRWTELFKETEFTKPVDFHSWRRAYCQSLANVGLSAQQAQKLAGHANLAAHERYLRNTAGVAVIPQDALPALVRVKPSAAIVVAARPLLAANDQNNAFSSVELWGIEPQTSALPVRRSPS